MIIKCENPSCGQKIKILKAQSPEKPICAFCGSSLSRDCGETEKNSALTAYLDIETTGLSPQSSDLTVVGLCVENKDNTLEIIQIVGEDISAGALERLVEGIETIYTYNGSRFDLKYIHSKLEIDIARMCVHKDLMYECWKRNLYGGLKSVESQLGIPRKLAGFGGEDAVRLWYNHLAGDKNALKILLEYNREDIVNLIALKNKLEAY